MTQLELTLPRFLYVIPCNSADPLSVSIVLLAEEPQKNTGMYFGMILAAVRWVVGSTGIMYNTKCAKTTQERRMQNCDLNVHHG